jgi:hypothetical protein
MEAPPLQSKEWFHITLFVYFVKYQEIKKNPAYKDRGIYLKGILRLCGNVVEDRVPRLLHSHSVRTALSGIQPPRETSLPSLQQP